MGTSVKMAWRNMWRNWRRTSIALVAIVLGLMLLLLMDGVIRGSDQAIFGNAVRLYGGNVQVHAPGFRDKATRLPLIPLEDADAVVKAAKEQPLVLAAAKRISTAGIVSSREGTFAVEITGIEPEVEAPLSIQAKNIAQGRFLLGEDGDAIFIGKGLADLLQVVPGDRVVLLGRSKNETMRQHSMTVVGIYDLGLAEAEKRMVFITLPEAQTLYNLRDQATDVSITLEGVGQESTVMAALQAALSAYEVDSWATLRPEIRQAIDSKAGVTTFLGLVVILIASIGILNLMMMAVFERTREMGVLAALGMKGRRIMGLFVLEGAMIGTVGAVAGCLLSFLIIGLLGRVGINYSGVSGMGEAIALMGDRLYPTVQLTAFVSRGLMVIVIAALASLYPAWQAAAQGTSRGAASCLEANEEDGAMAFGKLWTISYRDLGRNRRRSLLSLLAVALGLALLIMMNGLTAGIVEDTLQNSIRLQTGHVQLRAASYETEKMSLLWKDLIADPETLAARARAMGEVEAAAPVLWAGGVLNTQDDSAGLQVFGIDTESALYTPIREAMVAGAFLAADDRGGILIGKRLADSLGIGAGQKVVLTIVDANGKPDEGTFEIRGLFSTGIPGDDDSAVFMPLSKAQAFTGAGDHASAVVILLKQQNDADRVAAAFQSADISARTWQDLNSVFLQTMQTSMAFYVILDAIVILIVAVLIANTLLMSVFERIREMGILAALGMKGRQIMLMFILEAAMLGVAGIVVGIALGLAGVAYLATVGIYIGDVGAAAGSIALGTTMHGRFVPSSIASLSFWTLAIVLLASLYPAWFVARREPVDALRAL